MYVVFITSLSFCFVKSCRIERLYFKNDYFLELMVRWAARKLWGWWRVRSTFCEEWVGETQFPLYIRKHQVFSRELSDMWAECVGRGWILLLRLLAVLPVVVDKHLRRSGFRKEDFILAGSLRKCGWSWRWRQGGWYFIQVSAPLHWMDWKAEKRQGLRLSYKISMSASRNPTLPVKLYLLKIPQPSQVVTLAGDQVFKNVSLCREFFTKTSSLGIMNVSGTERGDRKWFPRPPNV